MPGRQLDLFSDSGIMPEPRSRPADARPALAVGELDDAALAAAIPDAGLADAQALAAEAGRRGLAAAVPALERLCRRFGGFGLDRAIPEQAAALEALARIGGPAAAQAVARLIAKDAVQGPTRKVAVGAAARLGAHLPAETVRDLLEHHDPQLRADACRCVGTSPVVLEPLLALAEDRDREVRTAAACALGRMGRREARVPLLRLLGEAPTPEVIDAIAPVADEDAIIVLGRISRTEPSLAACACDALEQIDHPRARQILAHLGTGTEKG